MGPVAKVVAIAAALGAWTLYNRVDAARGARAECQYDTLQASLEAERKRAETADRIASESRARAERTQKELDALEATTLEIISENAGDCPIPDDVRDRLLRIQ
jgi:hypothetical protein